MPKRINLCAGCGLPLTVSVLFVHDATGGPTGNFHTWPGCYGNARASRLGRPPAGDQAADPISAPETAPGRPRPVFGVSGGMS